jgi:purine-binding chemotaxis protein CheW
MISEATASAADLVGKYLIFLADGQEFSLPVTRVQELISVPPITRVPGAPRSIRGVINLRGKVVLVMDLRLRLELPAAQYDSHACIVIVQVRLKNGALESRGVLVDRVAEVVDLHESDIDPPDSDGDVTGADAQSLLLGVARRSDRVLSLLDPDALFDIPKVGSREPRMARLDAVA